MRQCHNDGKKSIESFNPRICKRCDNRLYKPVKIVCVSIHASVKDATFDLSYTGDAHGVSIHASVKDAT